MTATPGDMTSALVYVPRPTCDREHFPPELLAPDPVNTAAAGQQLTCPTCGRVWTTVIELVPGGRSTTVLQCATEPPAVDSGEGADT